MFGLVTSQRYRDGDEGIEEKPQGNVHMIVDITISNSQVYFLGFFSLKSTP